MPVRPGTALRRLLLRRPDADRDPVDVARQLVDAGLLVALETGDAALVERIGPTGLAPACDLTVPVDRLGVDAARELGTLAAGAGLAVTLSGPATDVEAVGLPGAGVVVPAAEPAAEDRCCALAGSRVRLVAGRRRGAADLAFVRCLNVLMAGEGHPCVAVSDPRLIAIAGERAAWNGRTSDSWELVMPYGVLPHEQRRLVAAGQRVRVAVPSGGRS